MLSDEIDGEGAALKYRERDEEKARWLPAEWKKGTESKDSINGKFYYEIRCKGTKIFRYRQILGQNNAFFMHSLPE